MKITLCQAISHVRIEITQCLGNYCWP